MSGQCVLSPALSSIEAERLSDMIAAPPTSLRQVDYQIIDTLVLRVLRVQNSNLI